MLQDHKCKLKRVREINQAIGVFRVATSSPTNIPNVKVSHRISRLFDGIESPLKTSFEYESDLLLRWRLDRDKKGDLIALDVQSLSKEKEQKVLSKSEKMLLSDRKENFEKELEDYLEVEETIRSWSKPMTIDQFGDLKLPYDFFQLMGDLIEQDDTD